MLESRSMQASTVIPVLGYPDAREGVNWLVQHFGFEVR